MLAINVAIQPDDHPISAYPGYLKLVFQLPLVVYFGYDG